MDYEKAYLEALDRAKAGKSMNEVFPELKESEDDRIREGFRRLLNSIRRDGGLTLNKVPLDKCFAYLEKQKEQKPERINITEMVAKYRVTDEYVEGEYKGKPVNCMIRAYEQGIRDTLLKVKKQKPTEDTALQKAFVISKKDYTLEEKCDALDYADTILPTSVTYGENDEEYKLHKIIEAAFIAGKKIAQKPAEWNEEDKLLIDTAIYWLERRLKVDKALDISTRACPLSMRETIERLKSLRPQPHWKPSEEQMNLLGYAYTQLKLQKCYAPHVYETLGSLYDDLKKL